MNWFFCEDARAPYRNKTCARWHVQEAEVIAYFYAIAIITCGWASQSSMWHDQFLENLKLLIIWVRLEPSFLFSGQWCTFNLMFQMWNIHLWDSNPSWKDHAQLRAYICQKLGLPLQCVFIEPLWFAVIGICLKSYVFSKLSYIWWPQIFTFWSNAP